MNEKNKFNNSYSVAHNVIINIDNCWRSNIYCKKIKWR